ncbi:TonB-dependent receptor [Novosphingobium umbonatum]|uniref:TonB-dependent receptor n=1 Tax=Novosphingobium umbonatum TaxID=1908524 RepID=A0A437MXD3_9SPHN|nr:TonB-dependent receptor [Novosphingobium umbonatum]RVU02307.1 TonB-dependent receptor [Novosphingobium umbonatum]
MPIWALLASLAAAGGAEPVLQNPVPAGPPLTQLQGAAAASGIAIALPDRPVTSIRRKGLPRGLPLRKALARICPAAGLDCRLTPMGVVVRPLAKPRPLRPPTPPAPPTLAPADILVTGRQGAGIMLASERAFSLSRLSPEDISRRPALSMAELLQNFPGLWIDTSAGTSANIARLRGIPMDGYSAMAVQEDGLPIQHSSLPWTDIDQFMRPDIMLESVDYVRGGPSSVLASNAPGGILNLHLRRPPDHRSGEARITATSYGLARMDAWLGGPLGEWQTMAGGYIARDPTQRQINQTLGGGQIRLRAERDLPDGRLTLTARYQDDASLNTSSFPMALRDGQWSALAGFDPRRGSWFGPDFSLVRFATANGTVTRQVGRNNRNRVFDLSAAWVQHDWTARLRLRRSDTERNAILSSGAPTTAEEFLASQGAALQLAFPASTAILRRSDGRILDRKALVEVVQPASATVQLDEMLGQIEHQARLGPHNLAGGLHLVVNRWRYQRIVARALVEARSQGLLVEALALDGAGNSLGSLTDGGYLSRASTWEQTVGRTASVALYATDEWQIAPQWRIEAGIRQEAEALHGIVGLPRSIDGSTATIMANRNLQVDSGQSAAYAASFAATNATLAVHRQIAPDSIGLFVRASAGHVLPSVGAYRTSSQPAAAHLLGVIEGEAGLVAQDSRGRISLTGFANRFTGLDVSSSVVDAGTGAITLIPRQAGSHTIGLELETSLALRPWAQWRSALTWQQSRLAEYRFKDASGAAQDYSGHVPQRIPDLMLHSGLDFGGRQAWYVQPSITYMGRRFADDANVLRLPPALLVTLRTGWTLPRYGQISLEIDNLANTIAVMQGDAIAGNAMPVQTYAIGRALAGRSLRLSFQKAW